MNYIPFPYKFLPIPNSYLSFPLVPRHDEVFMWMLRTHTVSKKFFRLYETLVFITMFGVYKSTATASSYAVGSIAHPRTLHHTLIISITTNDTNEWHPFISYSYKLNDRPSGPKLLACFKHGIDVGQSGRTGGKAQRTPTWQVSSGST
jgi:hypothetical protein